MQQLQQALPNLSRTFVAPNYVLFMKSTPFETGLHEENSLEMLKLSKSLSQFVTNRQQRSSSFDRVMRVGAMAVTHCYGRYFKLYKINKIKV
jgi:hypothetical protein